MGYTEIGYDGYIYEIGAGESPAKPPAAPAAPDAPAGTPINTRKWYSDEEGSVEAALKGAKTLGSEKAADELSAMPNKDIVWGMRMLVGTAITLGIGLGKLLFGRK